MPLADGETLLGKTLARALRVAGDEAPIVTVTGRDHEFITRDEYARSAPHANGRHRFLLEPLGRNTAPAVVLAALHVAGSVAPDAILLVLPADHLIADHREFAHAVERAQTLARDGWLVTFGIAP